MNKFSLKVLEAHSKITRLVGVSSDTVQDGTFHWTLSKEEDNASVGIDLITNNNTISLDIIELKSHDFEGRSISNDTLDSLLEFAGTYGIKVTMNRVLFSKDNYGSTFTWEEEEDGYVGECLEKKIGIIATFLENGQAKEAYKCILELHQHRKGLKGNPHKTYVFEMACSTLFSMAHDYERMDGGASHMRTFVIYTALALIGFESAVEKLGESKDV